MGKVIDRDLMLFKRVQQDDRLALNTLFSFYYQGLCSFANCYLRNSEESEEKVSDVFVGLWRTRHRLSIDRSVRAYLYISVKNACLAFVKRPQPIFENVSDFIYSSNLSDTNDPCQTLMVKELQAHMDDAIERLPPRCKQIFLMSRRDALTYKEISEILGLAEKTVENQIVKALDHIRRHIHLLNGEHIAAPVIQITLG